MATAARPMRRVRVVLAALASLVVGVSSSPGRGLRAIASVARTAPAMKALATFASREAYPVGILARGIERTSTFVLPRPSGTGRFGRFGPGSCGGGVRVHCQFSEIDNAVNQLGKHDFVVRAGAGPIVGNEVFSNMARVDEVSRFRRPASFNRPVRLVIREVSIVLEVSILVRIIILLVDFGMGVGRGRSRSRIHSLRRDRSLSGGQKISGVDRAGRCRFRVHDVVRLVKGGVKECVSEAEKEVVSPIGVTGRLRDGIVLQAEIEYGLLFRSPNVHAGMRPKDVAIWTCGSIGGDPWPRGSLDTEFTPRAST